MSAPADASAVEAAASSALRPSSPAGHGSPADGLALSVHGRVGVLDLLVPSGATALDVLREYARHTRTPASPRLFGASGREVPPGAALSDLGLRSGSLVVAAERLPTARSGAVESAGERKVGVSVTYLAVLGIAALAAVLGAVMAVVSGSDRELIVVLLLASAFVGVLPVGRHTAARVALAPVFAAAGGWLAAWSPSMERLPMTFGIAALSAAVAAGVGAALSDSDADGAERGVARVWMWAGGGVFVLAGLGAVLGLESQAVWAVLLFVAMVAGRVVPSGAVDVPDQQLVDLDRLAVSAWSARDLPRRSRALTLIDRRAVEKVVARGSVLIAAAAAAVLVVTLPAAPLLLATTHLPVDRIGAPILVTLVGLTHLLVARSYRHSYARWFLRIAGLWCLGTVLVMQVAGHAWITELGIAACVIGLGIVPVAVARGRGWRSVWWARRAEIAEALAVALSVPALVVTVGVFRRIWEIVG